MIVFHQNYLKSNVTNILYYYQAFDDLNFYLIFCEIFPVKSAFPKIELLWSSRETDFREGCSSKAWPQVNFSDSLETVHVSLYVVRNIKKIGFWLNIQKAPGSSRCTAQMQEHYFRLSIFNFVLRLKTRHFQRDIFNETFL